MPPPLIGWGIKRWRCLTSVTLSVAYIGPKSRTERPRKTKFGTEVAHVTSDSDTTLKVKSQRSRSPGRFTHLYSPYASGSCSGDRGNVFTVETYCYFAVRRGRLGGARRFGAHRGMRGAGAYCGGSRTACYIKNVTGKVSLKFSFKTKNRVLYNLKKW